MAGTFKFLLIGGVVVGIAGGTIAAIALTSKSDDKVVAQHDTRPAEAKPEAPPAPPAKSSAPPVYSAATVAEAADTPPRNDVAVSPEKQRLPEAKATRTTSGGGAKGIALPQDKKPPAPQPEVAPAASAPGAAPSATDAEKADAANEAGKLKLYEGKFKEASALFRSAIARSPEPKYFLNLGMSLFQEGVFDESLRALAAVLTSGGNGRVKENALKMARAVVAECDAQRLPCPPPEPLKTALVSN